MEAMNNNQGAVLITGASRGMGRHMALYLSARGFHVFAGCRKSADASGFAAENQDRLTPIILDVTDEQSISGAFEVVSKVVGEAGMKGLVNNAGIGISGPIEQMPIDMAEEQFHVNVIGPIAVTQKFLPLLRKGKGRIVNISSVSGFLTPPYAGIYSASKFALEAVSNALRMELKPWNIPVSVVQPGSFKTDFMVKSIERWSAYLNSLPEAEQKLYISGYEQMKRLQPDYDQIAPEPQPVSEAVFQALVDKSPQTRYLVGEDAQQVQGLLSLSDEDRDRALMQMWDQVS